MKSFACGMQWSPQQWAGFPSRSKRVSLDFLRPPDDDAVAARIVRLLEDGGSREEMCGQAAEDMRKRFDLEAGGYLSVHDVIELSR